MNESVHESVALDELRRRKAMFDTTWNLATVFAAVLVVLSSYLDLAHPEVGPVIWSLAGLGAALCALSARTERARTVKQLRSLALWTQLLGTALFAVAWCYFGGPEEPLLPLFVMLPLITGSLLFGFWQQITATLALVTVLLCSLILSPDMHALIRERYGISLPASHWMPPVRSAFARVTSSPTHDLLVIATLTALTVAVSATARALASICARAAERERSLADEVGCLESLAKDLVRHAPSPEVLVNSTSGRIVNASDRFIREFALPDATGRFLLDALQFSHPAVIKRLLSSGGEEIQGARFKGRETALRLRAEIMGSGERQMAAVSIDRCDEICWRGEVDALDDPVFAVNSNGQIAFLNRAALALFGEDADGVSASRIFDTGSVRWWDIAPLEATRRPVERMKHRYIAHIRRTRVADTIGELSFVHLQDGRMHAVAAS